MGAGHLSAEMQDLLAKRGKGNRRTHLQLDRRTTDSLVSELTERLAEIGFDTEYALTREGAMIESLIDVFGEADGAATLPGD